jgi:hypothetical protein
VANMPLLRSLKGFGGRDFYKYAAPMGLFIGQMNHQAVGVS